MLCPILTDTASKASHYTLAMAIGMQAALDNAGHGAAAIEYDGADLFVLMLGPLFVQSAPITLGAVYCGICHNVLWTELNIRNETRLHAWRLWRARSGE